MSPSFRSMELWVYGAFMHLVNRTNCAGGVSCLLLSFKERLGLIQVNKMEHHFFQNYCSL